MKRFFSLFLALILSFGVLPFAAGASETVTDAKDLYVQNGLKALCLAYDPTDIPASGNWQGEVGGVTLIGNWSANESGKGIGYASKSANFSGIELPTEALGASYTVEAVITPAGVLDSETGERKTGAASHDLAIQLGAFKAYGEAGVDTPQNSLALRYYYAPSGGLNANGGEYATWNSFLGYGVKDVMTYAVDHETDGASSRYVVRHDGVAANVLTVGEEDFVPFHLTDGRAQLFCYFPIDLYAVRVYDRVLTEAERAQNRFADLLLYHGIDPSLFWQLMSEEEQSALMLSAAHLSFNDKAAFDSLISSYLYDKSAVGSDALRARAREYSLRLLDYLALTDRTSVEKALSLVPATGADGDAVQALLDGAVEKRAPIELLLSFDGFASLSRERPELNAVFKADAGVLAILKGKYTVAYGALVGLSAVYKDYESLALTADGKAPANAAVYYAEEGDEDGFTYTVFWSEAYRNKTDYRHAVLFRGFVKLTDADGKSEIYYIDAAEKYETYSGEKTLSALSMYSAAKYFVGEYAGEHLEGYRYYTHPVLREVLSVNAYNIPARDEELKEADRLAELQIALEEGLKKALSVESVRYCDQSYSEFNEESIWVEYLADSVEGDDRIRPAYIYFPTKFDPDSKTDSQLKNAGVYRVFSYIGMPRGDGAVPGLMCVHGGGGQAYINYVKEALNHGYAAIAIDCDGETRADPTAPDGGTYTPDYLGMKKDSLADSDRDIEEQWMYYVQRALIYANTVLRSFERVDESAVGITGISWGGLTTTIAIGYDTRYAFAVPVYLSGNMDESVGSWSGDFYQKGLWYNDARLANATMPVLLINSDGDHYASLNTNALTYFDLPNAEMCIIHGYGHSQQKGASLSEIYAFGNRVTGYNADFMPVTKATPTERDGREYTLTLSQKSTLSDYTATLYYLTEPVSYRDSVMRVEWQQKALTVDGEGNILVCVPEEACVYYVSYTGYSKKEDSTPKVYFDYDGIIYGSTPLITVGSMGLYS